MRFLLPWLLLLPLLDLVLAAWLAGAYGAPVWWGLLAGLVVGVWLFRREKTRMGGKLMLAFNTSAQTGDAKTAIRQVFSSLGRLGAALFFMAPGFLTDVVAVALLLLAPAPRLAGDHAAARAGGSMRRGPEVIDAEVREVAEPEAAKLPRP
jgi:UPF0716 family protein affecting phage T7 exclusion